MDEFQDAYSALVEGNDDNLLEILQESQIITADSSFSTIPPKSDLYGRLPYPFLNIAALFQNFSAIEMLLEFGANGDCTDGFNNTPLHCASSNGNVQIMEYLLEEYNCNPIPTNMSLQLPIHIAAKYNQADSIIFLLETGKNDVDAEDAFGRTALSYAVENGNMDLIDFLITKANADPTTIDKLGNTLLHIAIKYHKMDAFNYLLSLPHFKHLNHINVYGQTPLHFAAKYNEPEMFATLYEHQADPRILDSKHRSVLLQSIESSSFDIFNFLLDNQLVFPAELDSTGASALHYAAKNHDVNFMRVLSTLNCLEPYINNSDCGYAPIHIAAKYRNYSVLQFLLSFESTDQTAEDCYGQTLLHMAARSNNLEFLQHALTIPGLDIFTIDKNGVWIFLFF